jgi:hypothetical protein
MLATESTPKLPWLAMEQAVAKISGLAFPTGRPPAVWAVAVEPVENEWPLYNVECDGKGLPVNGINFSQRC